jgi:hypothetical protein
MPAGKNVRVISRMPSRECIDGNLILVKSAGIDRQGFSVGGKHCTEQSTLAKAS